MQFVSVSLITLVLSAVSALGSPAPQVNPADVLEKRGVCKITGDGARCRRTPSLSADIIGEFAVGRSVNFSCSALGAPVNGVVTWDRTTVNGVICYVSDTLVSVPCPGSLPRC